MHRFKDKLRKITRRNRGRRLTQVIAGLTPVLRGWLTYCQYARCRSHVQKFDSWLRRKLRRIRIRQCKCVHALQKFLYRQGVKKWQSWIPAMSGKGLWRKSGTPQAHEAMSVERFMKQGLYNSHITLRDIKQSKKTAVCESMPGGVRGRGSNPPAYLINLKNNSFILISDIYNYYSILFKSSP